MSTYKSGAASTAASAVSFQSYLKGKYKKENQKCTHTRLKSEEFGVHGGSYVIEESDLDDFYARYYKHVMMDGHEEYLTEIQYPNEGPVLVDFDFKYESDVTMRIHEKSHVLNMVATYMEEIQKMYNIAADVIVPVYVFERQAVVPKTDFTKDGIHMIIGINMGRQQQMYLRKIVLEKIATVWSDLPIINKWDDVIDNSITSGKTGWQLYFSRKPGCKAYVLKYIFNMKMCDDEKWECAESQSTAFDYKKDFKLLTARYRGHISLNLKESVGSLIETMFKKRNASSAALTLAPLPSIRLAQIQPKDQLNNQIFGGSQCDYSLVKTSEQLDSALQYLSNSFETRDFELRETHRYTQSLGPSYYDNYDKWLRVGWALKNTSEKLFLSWMKFSSKSSKFSYGQIGEYYKLWQKFKMGDSSLTRRSIMYWSKHDNFQDFKVINESTVDYYIDKTLVTHVGKTAIKEASDVDLATVLFHLYKGRFVCVSIKHNIWYEFKNHRWILCDSGTTLRHLISTQMMNIYQDRNMMLVDSIPSYDNNTEEFRMMHDRAKRMIEVCTQLKTTGVKNNVLREAREMFYDKDFFENLDTNPYFMGFNNGVIDFKEQKFRIGLPDDSISKTTKIDFLEDYFEGSSEYASVEKEIKTFMMQLFPSPELNEYMWQHLASCLVGINRDQTFNIYNGTGSNGKSKLVELMSHCFGDYKATVPITLITEKRNKIGGTASEIAQLKGVRYAVMQEPSKGDKINEGPLKELSGGDPIQARALYQDMITFVPQFKLAVCTNVMFEVNSNDDGTWRRICKVDFESKFCENPDKSAQTQFQIDKRLDEKLTVWAPVFMTMLVHKAYKTGGIVTICDKVRLSSSQYRNSQDYLAEFIRDKINANDVASGIIKKEELNTEFKDWYIKNYNKNVPKFHEIHEYMDKRFKRGAKSGWSGCSIIYTQITADDF